MSRTKHVARVGTHHKDGAHIVGDALVESGVFAYLTAADDTTCTTKDTWYPIEGTFTNSPMENFSTTAGPPPGIQYDGECGCYYEIDWHASVVLGAGSDTIKVGVLVDGVEVASSVMTTFVTTATLQMSGTTVVFLEAGEVVTLVVQAASDGTVVTFTNFTTTLGKFFANPQG